MITPIVSPWLIYFANCCGNMIIVCAIIAFANFAFGFAYGLHEAIDKESFTDEYCLILKRKSRKCIILASLFMILTACIPSTDTCYKMIAANIITYENVDSVKGLTKDMVDYIFEKIGSLSVNGE